MIGTGLVAATLAALVSPSFAEGATAEPTGACYTVWVAAPRASGKPKTLRRSLSFSAREILDLQFFVALPGGGQAAGKKIELKLFTPRGHLYQTLLVPSTETEALPSSTRRKRFRTVTATLPVAGTTIVNNSLYGAWRAEAYVEGETSPCGRPRVFEIQP